MRTALAIFVCCLAAMSAAAMAEPHADLGRILAQVEAAYGGRDAITAIPGFRASGKILSLADGVNGRIRLIVDLGGRMRTEIDYPSRHEVRILSGRLAWNGDPQGQSSANAAMATSMRLQFHRVAAPFELVEASPGELELLEDGDDGLWRVSRQWSTDSSRTTYEIDPETGWIVRVRGEMAAGHEPLEFVSESADFRDIEGVMFPFRITTIISGQVASETIVDRVRVESEFRAVDFLPTGSAEDF
jgi:hypothetical protein